MVDPAYSDMGQRDQTNQPPGSHRNTNINGYGTIYKKTYYGSRAGDETVTTMYVRARLGRRRTDPDTGRPLVGDDTDQLGRPRYVLADYGLDPIRIPGELVTEIVSGRDYSMGRVLYLEPSHLDIRGPADAWTAEERSRWADARDRMARENRAANQAAREMMRAALAIRAAHLGGDLDGMDLDAVVPGGAVRRPPPDRAGLP